MQTPTKPRPFAFVLMPFDSAFEDTYQLAILPACEAAGAYAERVDKQIFSDSIIQRIYNQIAKADLVIADMTGRNANVFYEVGYAHALGKTTLLLTKTAEDIPFDLKDYPHIVYGSSLTDLKSQLERRVRWHIENPANTQTIESTIEARVNGVYLENTSVIELKPQFTATLSVSFKIELHNKAVHILKSQLCQLGILSSNRFCAAFSGDAACQTVHISDELNLHSSSHVYTMMPEQWDRAHFDMITEAASPLSVGESHPFCLRIYTETGHTDRPFIIKLV